MTDVYAGSLDAPTPNRSEEMETAVLSEIMLGGRKSFEILSAEVRYKQLTGIVELFRKVNYSVSWSSDGNNGACREFDEVSKE